MNDKPQAMVTVSCPYCLKKLQSPPLDTFKAQDAHNKTCEVYR